MILSLIAEGGHGGFDPFTLSGGSGFAWTLLIFVAALVPAWKVVFGPVVRALEERDDRAARAIEQAETASAEAEAARAEVEVRLGEARSEAAKLLAAARDRAEEREREIVEAAKGEASSLLDSARDAIRTEQDKALSAIRSEVVELTLGAAEQVLKRKVDDEDTRRLVGELVTAAEAKA
jgi:F-type H+-transporting ATPase subunit b